MTTEQASDHLDRNRRTWDRMAPGYDRQMRRLKPLLIGRDDRPWSAPKPKATSWRSPWEPASTFPITRQVSD